MPRVKRGTTHLKRRRQLLKRVKGFKLGRKNLIKQATTAATKAGQHAYRDRKKQKRNSRRLWNIKINAAARQAGLTYSSLINKLKINKIILDRKSLANIAEFHPSIFEQIIATLK